MTPAERADKVREVISPDYLPTDERPEDWVARMLPAGSVVLTPDEQEQIRLFAMGGAKILVPTILALLGGDKT